MTLLYHDPSFLKHQTGDHPENPRRLLAILHRLESAHVLERCQSSSFSPLPVDDVSTLHDPSVAVRARQLAARGGGLLEADTYLSRDSYDVALAASGACAAAVDAVLTGTDRTALCLVRPPGHHATASQSMGFCIFNNIALAADHARRKHGLERILIIDWDVHHGNGTQDIFYEDPQVYFLSIHRYGWGFYPGTGSAEETGTGRGLGFTLNVPVRFGTTRPDYLNLFKNAVEKAADAMKPELILISAGFDAHHHDPIGSLGLETEDFAQLTRVVKQVAAHHSQGRLVSCLEGGYNLDALAESVEAHLQELLSD